MRKIDFIQYRKLKNIEIEFNNNLNVLSGGNGTCKSSILHIISNGYQKPKKSQEWIIDKGCLDVINKFNKLVNPKIESLTLGDKEYNDPAIGVNGKLYECYYENKNYKLSFRRHNSSTQNKKRFAVKPYYQVGKNDSLPIAPVIYMGLFRLFSLGEYNSDDTISNIVNSNSLPKPLLEELSNMYEDFTSYKINLESIYNMGDIKKRSDFTTNKKGIDSNTISAGEDNLFIILFALMSLKYYYLSVDEDRRKMENISILLIDELDASLHPEFQIKLIEYFTKFSEEFKIQIFFTTHSLSLINYCLENKNNCKVIYLIDDINSVYMMDDPDKYKINMHLKNITKSELYLHNKIPIISEDAEARIFINLLFEFYKNKKDIHLDSIFHIVEANLSSESIKRLTNDDYLLKSTLRTVNILDGDQMNEVDLSRHLICLPGLRSPEEIIFNHAMKLYGDNKDDFWRNSILQEQGMTKKWFVTHPFTDIKTRNIDYKKLKDSKKSTKGFKREQNKKIFSRYEYFWKFVLMDWLNDEKNIKFIDNFFKDLNILFMKTCEFHNLSKKEWTYETLLC